MHGSGRKEAAQKLEETNRRLLATSVPWRENKERDYGSVWNRGTRFPSARAKSSSAFFTLDARTLFSGTPRLAFFPLSGLRRVNKSMGRFRGLAPIALFTTWSMIARAGLVAAVVAGHGVTSRCYPPLNGRCLRAFYASFAVVLTLNNYFCI